MLFYFAKASGSICITVCFGGKYCDSDKCLPCKTGTYRSDKSHYETFCIDWTQNTGQFFKVLQNGSSTQDIVWGCIDGYEIRNINAAGGQECVKSITSTVTVAKQSTVSTKTTAIPNTTLTTGITVDRNRSQDLEKTYIIVIVVGIFFLIALIIFVAFISYKRYKNHQLQNLFTLLVQVLEIKEFPNFCLHLSDPSRKFKRYQNMETSKKCIEVLQSWKNLNHSIAHSVYIVNALAKVGCRLHSDIDKTDNRQVINHLEKLNKLNIEFRKFCNLLCEKLGNDSVELAIQLELGQDFDNRKREMSGVQLALSASLVKWSLSYPYSPNPNKDWYPLTEIRNVLPDLGRNDLEQTFPELAENVYNFLGNNYDIQDHPNENDVFL
ncbi:hypothetical protein Btru_054457 [Bulinus truncatus]|nr:hypothetical protein Btru_054457 [Bulinus truncatus]